MVTTKRPRATVRLYGGGIYEIVSPIKWDLGAWSWRYAWKPKYGNLLSTTLYSLYDRVHHTNKLNNYGQHDLKNIAPPPFYTSFPHFDFLKGL